MKRWVGEVVVVGQARPRLEGEEARGDMVVILVVVIGRKE